MNKIIKLKKNPKLIVLFFMGKGILNWMNDKHYLKIKYRLMMGKKLNLINPKTYTEKLQWLKLYDRKKIYTTMVDKFEAKKYVSSIIGEEYIIPTLGIYNKFEEIDFNKLPNQFVMKCTHDSGGLVICKDKKTLDIKKAGKKIKKCLKRNYYYGGREWPYKNVKPRIIIEKYMVDESGTELKDYKFFCFNGRVKFFKIDFDRFYKHRANYYTINKKILPFGEKQYPPQIDKKINMPNNLTKMIEIAEHLSQTIDFVRIDFYEIDSKIFFGEITFYPSSGFDKIEPEEWDKKIGDMLEISKGEMSK